MKFVKFLIPVVIVAIVGWLAWNYFAGPLRYQREMHAFADSLETCQSFSEPVFMFMGNTSLLHAVEPSAGDQCDMRMETAGPHVVHCTFERQDLPMLADGFRTLADSVDLFGGYTFQYSSSDPDPLTRALNSEACESRVP